MKKILNRFIPLAFIIIAMGVIYFSGMYHYVTFETLKYYDQILESFVIHHFIWISVLYILIYITAAALSFPGAFILTIFGGYFFPQPLCTIYVVCSATCGATIVFLVTKTALGDSLKDKAIPFLKKMEKGFKEHGASYLLFLRFIPIFPFWIMNIAPAFLHISIKSFIWTTFVGVIPGSIVLTLAGSGLKKVFENNEVFSIHTVFNTQMKIALCLLGFLALSPILYKKIMKKLKKTK